VGPNCHEWTCFINHRVRHPFWGRDLILIVGGQTEVYISKISKLVLFKFFMRKRGKKNQELVLILVSVVGGEHLHGIQDCLYTYQLQHLIEVVVDNDVFIFLSFNGKKLLSIPFIGRRFRVVVIERIYWNFAKGLEGDEGCGYGENLLKFS